MPPPECRSKPRRAASIGGPAKSSSPRPTPPRSKRNPPSPAMQRIGTLTSRRGVGGGGDAPRRRARARGGPGRRREAEATPPSARRRQKNPTATNKQTNKQPIKQPGKGPPKHLPLGVSHLPRHNPLGELVFR